jgi:hypothetical protein
MPIKRTRLLNRKVDVRDAKLFIIATEGEKTEKQYFDIFENPKIRVVVIPSEGGKSAPKYVLERLDSIKNLYDFGEGDELWLMIDTDRWGAAALSEVCQGAIQKSFQLAVSNPCFELWLYLHFNDVLGSNHQCRELEKLLRQHLGSYNKANLDTEAFKPHIQNAVKRAKSLHTNKRERWSSSTGTHVYKVVEKLM